MTRLGLLVLTLAALLAAPAFATHTSPHTTEEQLGTAVQAGPAQASLDPGFLLSQKNPRVILPGTTELQARLIVLDSGGAGVTGVAVGGRLQHLGSGGVTQLSFKPVSPGVYHSGVVAYPGGEVALVVEYDFDANGVVDHAARWKYAPLAPMLGVG